MAVSGPGETQTRSPSRGRAGLARGHDKHRSTPDSVPSPVASLAHHPLLSPIQPRQISLITAVHLTLPALNPLVPLPQFTGQLTFRLTLPRCLGAAQPRPTCVVMATCTLPRDAMDQRADAETRAMNCSDSQVSNNSHRIRAPQRLLVLFLKGS